MGEQPVGDGFRRWAPVVLAVVLASTAGLRAEDGDDDEWKIRWNDGFEAASSDGRFRIAFGGAIQADWTFVDQDQRNEAFYSTIDDGNEFRRARLRVAGTLYERVRFKAEYDFAEGDADFKDVWVEFTKTPVGSVRVGHFKEPFSLEALTDGTNLAFLERSLPDVLAPARNTGIMLHGQRGERFTWAVGAFRETDDDTATDTGGTEDASRGKVNYTLRLTRLTWYKEDGRRLAHVGISATRKDLGADRFWFRTRPEVHQQSQRFLETGRYFADATWIYNVEFAAVADRFWAAAEVTSAQAKNVSFTDTDPVFDGGYVQLGVFLTKDHRAYDTAAGTFGRTRPATNFGAGGSGAWEIAVRYSRLDLLEAQLNAFRAGKQDNASVAINWYPNPASRVMLDYIRADPELPMFRAGRAEYFTLRFQVDF